MINTGLLDSERMGYTRKKEREKTISCLHGAPQVEDKKEGWLMLPSTGRIDNDVYNERISLLV